MTDRYGNEMMFDYQLDRHWSKTVFTFTDANPSFDYQLDRHCSKTEPVDDPVADTFDYQLDRHCSKTKLFVIVGTHGLITS